MLVTMSQLFNKEKYFAWQAPSNIALIKYWGKKHFQLPMNPSISMTLDSSLTKTYLWYEKKASEQRKVEFHFEGKENPSFLKKIILHIELLEKKFPILKKFSFKIESENTFPHSAGIASSASSMAALNLCFCSILKENDCIEESDFFQIASELSRLASGSASRSLFESFVEWGIESEKFATPLHSYHEDFQTLCDAILIISKEEKSISSRAGHSLMENHPYSKVRYDNAKNRTKKLLKVLKEGDWQSFIRIVEQEALELHAMMMCSSPSFILMKPNSLKIIELIKSYRESSGLNICFTLDAGPNIHLLYPEKIKNEVSFFIERELKIFLDNGMWIDDKIGKGPISLL